MVRLTVVVRTLCLTLLLGAAGAFAGDLNTTDSTCTVVNENVHYATKQDVWIHGNSNLVAGSYYLWVVAPGGKSGKAPDDILGASSGIAFSIDADHNWFDAGGNLLGVNGCLQVWSVTHYADTTNAGNEYQVLISQDPLFEDGALSRSDNFKVRCTQPATPRPTNDGPYCDGGTIHLFANVTADGYFWTGPNNFSSPDQNPTLPATLDAAGTYSLVVEIGTCWSEPGFTVVVVNPLPTPTISPGDPHFCAGGSVTLTASPGDAKAYQWYLNGQPIDGATSSTYVATQEGDYTVSVTDANGCTGTSAPVHVTVYPLPDPVIVAKGPTTFCSGGSVELDATLLTDTAVPFSYQWYLNGSSILGATDSKYLATATGLYTVSVTDAHGCTKVSDPIAVNALFCGCTLTQGAYGSTGGAGTVSQVQGLIGSGLTAGSGARSFALIASDAQCFVYRMPAGGIPAILPSGPSMFTSGYSSCSVTFSSLLKNGKFTDVLMGQTFTLALNIRNTPPLAGAPLCLSMSTQKLLGNAPDPNSVPVSFTMPSSVISWLTSHGGATAGNLLALANAALGGASGLPPLSDINTAVNNVNVNFDGCRALVTCN